MNVMNMRLTEICGVGCTHFRKDILITALCFLIVFLAPTFSYSQISLNPDCSRLKNPQNFDGWAKSIGVNQSTSSAHIISLNIPTDFLLGVTEDELSTSANCENITGINTKYQFMIYNAASGNAGLDPNITCSSLPVLPPGHTHSIRIGNTCRDKEVEGLYYSMKVNDPLLLIHYAVVMESNSDNLFQKPFFSIKLKDLTGQPLLSCGSEMIINESATDTLWEKCSNGLIFRKWNTATIDLRSHIGTDIILEFIMADGSVGTGTRFGYAYVAAECKSSLLLTANSCEPGLTDVVATVAAPVELTCKWYIKKVGDLGYGIPIQGERATKDTLELYQSDFDLIPGSDGLLVCVAVFNSDLNGTSCEKSIEAHVKNEKPNLIVQSANLCGNYVVLNNKSIPSSSRISDEIDTTKTVWDMADGAGTILYDHSQVSHTYSPGITNTKVIVSIESMSGCVNTKEIPIQLFPSINVELLGKEASYCAGDNGTFQAQGAGSYEWFVGSDSVYYQGNSIQHTFRPIDTVLVLRGKSVNGCIDEVQEKLNILPGPSLSLKINDTVMCIKEQVRILASTDSTENASIIWRTALSGGLILGMDSVLIHLPDKTTTYYAFASSGGSCNAVDSLKVRVVTGELVANKEELCPADSVWLVPVFQEKSAVDAITFTKWFTIPTRWDLGGQRDSLGLPSARTTTYIGNYVVYKKSGKTCNIDLIKKIIVHQLPTLKVAIKPGYIDKQEPIVLFEDNSENRVSCLWDFGDGTSSTEQFSKYKYQGDILEEDTVAIKLFVYNKLLCKKDTIMFITVRNFEIHFPSAFTPGQSNDNSIFKPVSNSSELSLYHLRIYSRWGDLVFESRDINTGWDGKSFKGADCTMGAYVWILNCRRFENERTYIQKGNVMLLR